MRKFVVFLNKKVARCSQTEQILEFEDNASDEEIEEACQDCLDTMIENDLYTGWDEIFEDD
jgi:hypothetical protein